MQYDTYTIRYDTIRYDAIRYDTIQSTHTYNTFFYHTYIDMTLHDITLHDISVHTHTHMVTRYPGVKLVSVLVFCQWVSPRKAWDIGSWLRVSFSHMAAFCDICDGCTLLPCGNLSSQRSHVLKLNM